MDQKRLFLAIAVSLAILLGFQMLVAPHLPKPPPQQIALAPDHPATTPLAGAPGAAVRPRPRPNRARFPASRSRHLASRGLSICVVPSLMTWS